MDKLIEKLIGALSKLGLEESVINGVIAEVTAPDAPTEEVPPSGDPDLPPSDDVVPPTEDVPPTEEEDGKLPPSDVPPAEETQEAPNPQEVPNDVPPAAPVPPFDPTDLINSINELKGQNDELAKANEGLIARVNSLEEALKNAGVIDGTNPTTQVGDPLPTAAPQSPTDDVFSSVLSELNGHKRF